MHISIPNDVKKQFHAACALRGLKMSQVMVELIKQWLASEAQSFSQVRANASKLLLITTKAKNQ